MPLGSLSTRRVTFVIDTDRRILDVIQSEDEVPQWGTAPSARRAAARVVRAELERGFVDDPSSVAARGPFQPRMGGRNGSPRLSIAEGDVDAPPDRRSELQERVGQIKIEVRAGKMLHLAASAGAAVFPHDGTSYEALLAEADHRMYRDKAARRTSSESRAPWPEFMLTSVYGPATQSAV